MAHIKSLNYSRGYIKGQLTRFTQFVDTCTTAELSQLPSRLARAESLIERFDKVQADLEAALVDEAADDQELRVLEAEFAEERNSFENAYYKAIDKARKKIPHNSEPTPSANTLHARVNEDISGKVKLPTITLPTFNGHYDQWLLFKDSFNSLIHSNTKLSEVQKFQYLRSSVTEEALQVIQSLETSPDNYQITWSLLTKRYENKRLIINTHLKELLDPTPIQKGNLLSLRQFIDNFQRHIRALASLGQPTDNWDTILIHILGNKLDFNLKKDWEVYINEKEANQPPTMKQWIEFLTNRCQTLELIESPNTKRFEARSNNVKKNEKKVLAAVATNYQCQYCNGSHQIYRCEEFTKLSVIDRQKEAKNRNLCINCLKRGHYSKDCQSSQCRKCNRQHNTLLHIDKEGPADSQKVGAAAQASSQNKKKEESSTTAAHALVGSDRKAEEADLTLQTEQRFLMSQSQGKDSHVILSTAQVQVFDSQGNPRECRVLLDPGSQSNLVTRALVKRLNLTRKKVQIPISGVNQSKCDVNESVQVKLKSRQNAFNAQIECLVLETITEPLPQLRLNSNLLNIPKGIHLADPQYHYPGTIDMLIGAGLFWKLLCVGRVDLGKGFPMLQKTLLGWVIGGEFSDNSNTSTTNVCHLTLDQRMDKTLEKFWITEEIITKKHLTEEEKMCEQHFQETTRRSADNRFIVSLPKRPEISLGDSRSQAFRRFLSTERRLQDQPQLREQYVNFMNEYEQLGHMSIVKENHKKETSQVYYLPHQPVVREASLTTKLRVVFDGSAKTSTGTSLNDKLMIGPNLQEDLFEIIIRFRTHQYVLTADVAKMFRQILVTEEDRDLQRIVWRPGPTLPIEEYTLNTVTYGTSCAPYLAIRCMKQLALEASEELPQASTAILEDCYMDDILTGCNTLGEAIILQEQLDKLTSRGRFPLRKWRSNSSEVLNHIALENKSEDLLTLESGETQKVLGLLWNAAADTLQYTVNIQAIVVPTKRNILSQIARIFDPMGLIGPILIVAKMIMQELWKIQLNWDESVPQSLSSAWYQYYSSLPKINQLRIERNVNPNNTSQDFNLHGFSDASERAYGACIYCVYLDDKGRTCSNILCSKTKVAPLKCISLPRLELCAALLMARLANVVSEALGNKVKNLNLWSDSTIVLGWVKTPPHMLKTFVANRVAEIQESVPKAVWRHVPSAANPADLLSRGIPVDSILDNSLWWEGPRWLTVEDDWPEPPSNFEQIPELKVRALVVTYNPPEFLYKFSRFPKLQRVIAYVLRFVQNSKGNRLSGSLTVKELQEATNAIIRMVQRSKFQKELEHLQLNKPLKRDSSLLTLNPFVDENGLIRVGGRLRHADLSRDQKHPIVLPARDFVTTLIMREEHQKLLHCGPELLLNSVRNSFWPLSGRREARKIVRNCLRCFRYSPTPKQTIMADLPKSRLLQLSRPFERCGVDYAGPFNIRESKRRGRVPITKAYVAVFVCFSTKAVHLELVTKLDTEAFLAALRRFASRRGTPSHIYSDNGTNFKGADKELTEIYDFLKNEEKDISTGLTTQKINWHFIPPRSPHFGGLWEAAVKSVKRHVRITMQGLIYSYEEYNTLLIEIEAILNSRPLTPLSSDPKDLSALTPAHFLIGDSLLEPAQHDYRDLPDNRLSRWQHLQKLRQHFWKRWHREYLNQLQSRTKWTEPEANVEVGSLVLLIDDNLPPLSWPMGRVVEVHPGDDDVVRVATVRTSSGIFKRAVRKLCVLPKNG